MKMRNEVEGIFPFIRAETTSEMKILMNSEK